MTDRAVRFRARWPGGEIREVATVASRIDLVSVPEPQPAGQPCRPARGNDYLVGSSHGLAPHNAEVQMLSGIRFDVTREEAERVAEELVPGDDNEPPITGGLSALKVEGVSRDMWAQVALVYQGMINVSEDDPTIEPHSLAIRTGIAFATARKILDAMVDEEWLRRDWIVYHSCRPTPAYYILDGQEVIDPANLPRWTRVKCDECETELGTDVRVSPRYYLAARGLYPAEVRV